MFVPKIDVINGVRRAGFLCSPGFAVIIGMHDCAAGSHNPAVLIINKVDVNKLPTCRRLQNLPRVAAVFGESKNAVYHIITAAGRANDPPSFLSVKAKTVEFARGAFRLELSCLTPGAATVVSSVNTRAGENETNLL